MTEQKPEKKVVSRTVAIALGIICIVLAVSLVGTIAEITSLNSTIATQNPQVEQFNTARQTGIVASVIWVNNETVSQSPNSYTSWNFSANYYGYVYVFDEPLRPCNIYMEVIWSSPFGINYDSGRSIGFGVTAGLPFPILPSSSIQIRIGNNDSFNDATEAVTITYYY